MQMDEFFSFRNKRSVRPCHGTSLFYRKNKRIRCGGEMSNNRYSVSETVQGLCLFFQNGLRQLFFRGFKLLVHIQLFNPLEFYEDFQPSDQGVILFGHYHSRLLL